MVLRAAVNCGDSVGCSTVVDKKSGRPRHVDPIANFHLRNGASIGLIIRCSSAAAGAGW